MKRLVLFLLGASAAAVAAQDGGQLYALNCSACHGNDGKGATGGAFPPLANSPWVTGDPALPIKIVLNGLEGVVEVAGKTYNLAMPPHGAVLGDAEVAAVLSFVRSSWGNSAAVITGEQVKAVRTQSAARKQPWTGPELLKDHPLKIEAPALSNLTSRAYFGEFQQIPDFSTAKQENIEEENDGLISASHGLRPANFAVLWEAQFNAPADGEYTFKLDSDDLSRVTIKGTKVVEILDIGPMGRAKEAKLTLTKGAHPIRIEFVQGAGDMGISLGWKGPGVENWKWLSDQSGRGANPWPNIPVQPLGSQLAIYRNFIGGTTPRAIGIGFPTGVNLAWSADNFAPELVWHGLFMDGGRHWTDRGTGDEPPAGQDTERLSNAPAFAALAEASSRWPEKPQLATRFRGYKLGTASDLTFSLESGGCRLLDHYAADGAKTLVRTLRSDAATAEPLALLLVRGKAVKDAGNGTYEVEGGLTLTLKAGTKVRLLEDGSLTATVEGKAPIEIRYSWR
jgi:mono/diheme cytochrome c family protein